MRYGISPETYIAKVSAAVIWFCFTAFSLYIAPFHEIWADEVQAFLIARDASFSEILTVIPHQEGQPVLWHLLLKLLIAIFGEELNITYVSIAVMSITVGIFLFCCRVPLIYKILLPFGHYFLYQYNIISRNYCLAYLAMVLLAVLYDKRHRYICTIIAAVCRICRFFGTSCRCSRAVLVFGSLSADFGKAVSIYCPYVSVGRMRLAYAMADPAGQYGAVQYANRAY